MSRTQPTVRVLNVLCHPITIVLGGAGIFNLLPIAYAFLPQLRGRLTQGRRPLPWKPSAFGEEDFHLLYRYSCHASSLVIAPALLTVHLRRNNNALLPLHIKCETRNFGSMLESRKLSAQSLSIGELLRTL